MIKSINFVKQRKTQLGIIAAIIVLTCAITFTAFAASTKVVDIYHDDTVTQVRTLKSDPAEIITQSDISLGKDDFIDLSAFSSDKSAIRIYRACRVSLNDDGKISDIIAVKDVEKTFEKNNVKLRAYDTVNCKLSDKVYDGMKISIERAFSVTLRADGNENELEMAPGTTVADAVQRAGITLSDDDEVVPNLNTPLEKGILIEVLRVQYKERTENEIIEYNTVTKKSDKLFMGETKVTQNGRNGENRVVYTDKYVNGELDSSKVKTQTVLKKPVDKIKVVGTHKKVVLKSGLTPISTLKMPSDIKINSNGVPSSYKKAVTATAFAYSGGGNTASGRKARPGHIAVNPKQFPYGTELWIVSADGKYVYGYSIAADTGSFIYSYDNAVDLYMNSNSQCNAWGRREVVIYVL
ncbi:MAG: DUF348 domain-containing protein [Clostridiales bacterium]|nr:DUF348 domain-containing protein [Clostridiales bacterium]